MPMYVWMCDDCGEETIVVRAVSEIEEGPEEKCPKCGGTFFTRIVCAPINRWRYCDE